MQKNQRLNYFHYAEMVVHVLATVTQFLEMAGSFVSKIPMHCPYHLINDLSYLIVHKPDQEIFAKNIIFDELCGQECMISL